MRFKSFKITFALATAAEATETEFLEISVELRTLAAQRKAKCIALDKANPQQPKSTFKLS